MSIEEEFFANAIVCKHPKDKFQFDAYQETFQCTICGKEWLREELLGDDDDLSN